jgi:hypothetical protein
MGKWIPGSVLQHNITAAEGTWDVQHLLADSYSNDAINCCCAAVWLHCCTASVGSYCPSAAVRRPCEKGRWCPEGSIKSQSCNITVGPAGLNAAPAASGSAISVYICNELSASVHVLGQQAY